MADDTKPGRDRGCCGDVDEVGREANERAELQAPEWLDDDEIDDLDFCGECGDTFRYDDCGGYNPPCACGFACQSCCEHGRPQFCANERTDDDGLDEDDEDDE